MSHIYEALKKLDRETSSKRFGWGPIGTEILKPEPLRPPKRIRPYLIHVLLTAFVTAAITYGLAVKSGLLWQSPSPTSEILPAPRPQVAQIPPGVADPMKTLPPAPGPQVAQIPGAAVDSTKTLPAVPGPQVAQISPRAAEVTKTLPPVPAKSPAPIQKLTPPSPEAGSLQKSSPSPPPRYGVPDRKSAPPPLVSSSPPKVSSLPPVQPPADVLARKSIPPPLVSGSSPKVPSLPPVQPPAPEEEDSGASSQTTKPDAPIYVSPKLREELERLRRGKREPYGPQREAPQRNLPLERKFPVPPATEGIASPPIIPRVPEVLPGASPQAAAQSPKTSAGGLPQLKISGIVWHEQPAMRRAVINGSFTSEGSQIEGVKVLEILPTRVRFSYQNQVFEISAFE